MQSNTFGGGESLTMDKLRAAMALVANIPPAPPPARFRSNTLFTVTKEDWSSVRSHGRAARRRKRGHRQNIRFVTMPDPKLYSLPDGEIHGHPETVRAAMDAIDAARSHYDYRNPW